MVEKKRKKSDLADQFLVRMPDGLRIRIAEAAQASNRSMNAEIIATLEKAYPEIPNWEEFQSDIGYLLDAYKNNQGRDWSRQDLRGIINTVVHQIAHGKPEETE